MRKFLTYMCAVLLMSSSAFSYYGGYSAYELYQLAASGNIRSLQDAARSGSGVNATDSNGQTAICYAITNRDYVAYRNLAMLHADEHPSCVKQISKHDYEDFKRGYELRGGKISSSLFSFSGSTAAWTIAGVAAVGAGVAVAAGGGGGGGGGSSDTPEPTPPPTPTPTEECKSFTLSVCPQSATCDSCLASTGIFYKITGCKEGYVLNSRNNGCIPDPSVPKNYPLEQCDPNGRCSSAMFGDVRMYKLLSCNENYVFSSDHLACEFLCEGYIDTPCENSQYMPDDFCGVNNTYHHCIDRQNTDHCKSYKTNEDKCTECYNSGGKVYKLTDEGTCVETCMGMVQKECDRLEYISETCVDNPNYHTCTPRTNTEGCALFDSYNDVCTACDGGYDLQADGSCQEHCKGYSEECDISTQYEGEECPTDPNYHICKDRTIIVGCSDYDPKADKCISCEEGYKLSDGTCVEICVGYEKGCKKSTHYRGAQCVDNENYYKCEVRTNTKGCKDYVIDADKCSSCRDGYDLQADGTCKSACPDEYQDEPCAKLEYIPADGICPNDDRFHKCTARKVTYGCDEYDLYADRCISCLEDFELNNGACQDICPGYTKEECYIWTHWEDKHCSKAPTKFHTCEYRLNTIGCSQFSKTSDTCTKCDGTSSTPVGGKCSCDGHDTRECDKPTEYISAVCATAAGYHVCTPREHTEGCTEYDEYSDTCTKCVKADYYLPESHICTLREHTEGCKERYETDDTCLSCEKNDYYLNRKSGRSDGICTPRERTDGCTIFEEFSDTCLECTKSTHYLPDDTKICTPREHTDGCITYSTNTDTCTSCTKETHYLPDSTKICTKREHTDGCLTYNTNSDTCTSCTKETHFLPSSTSICTKREHTDGCTGYNETSDTCTSCTKSTHYLPSSTSVCTVREHTKGCETFSVDTDTCLSCTKASYYLPDDTKICTPRVHIEGCIDFNETTDTCSSCVKATHYLNASNICTPRENTANCLTFKEKADECLSCDEDYKLENGKCVHICKNYQSQGCNLSQYYETFDCPDEAELPDNMKKYRTCNERLNVIGCEVYVSTKDECKRCDSDHTLQGDGTCKTNASLCSGYTKTECNTSSQFMPLTEYGGKSPTCDADPSYHLCVGRNNSTVGCANLDPNNDKCLECKDKYKKNPSNENECIEMCPASEGYTTGSCSDDKYQNGDCTSDPTYHKCTARTNDYTHCSKKHISQDKCETCEDGYLPDSNGVCQYTCPPKDGNQYKLTCDTKNYYYGETCTKDPRYRLCIPRTNKLHCTDFNSESDDCTACDSGYEVGSGTNYGKCVQICPGYQKEACDNKTHWTGDTCSTTHPDYHKCNLRTNRTYCTEFVVNADKCSDCKEGYEVNSSGSCVQICPGYFKTCENGWHVQKDASGNPVTCSATHPDYYKCELDKDAKNIPGCKVYADDKQSCKQCEDWYTLGGGGSSCNKCSDTIANCEKPFPDSCKCQTCAQGMKVDDEGKCVELENTGGGGSSGGGSGSGDDGGDDPSGGGTTTCDELIAQGYNGGSTTVIYGETIRVDAECSEFKAVCGNATGYPDGYAQHSAADCPLDTMFIHRTCWLESESRMLWKCKNRSYKLADHPECKKLHVHYDGCGQCDSENGYTLVGLDIHYPTCQCTRSGGCGSSGGGDSTCTSSCSSNAYYKDQTNCDGDEGVCTARTNYPIDECDTYSEFSDSCAICENGYGVGNNTGSNVPDSNGLCLEQSSSGVSGNCKLSCNLTIEYENQELNSECDGEKVFCAVRKYATNCGTSGFSQYADRCTACQSGVQLKKANSSDTDGYCLTTNGCQASPQACLENDKINTYYALVGTSISDEKLKTVYNSICGTAQTSEAVCVERTPIANCAQYSQLSDKCSKCKYDSSNKCLGVSIDNICYADKYGLCEGNASYSGEAPENPNATVTSKVVKVFDVTEDKENGKTVFVALDNKLDTFNAAIRQYNGNKSNSTQRIIVSGEFDNAADITGAYNVHNGSLKGGVGTVEIIRDEESPTPIEGAVKGLVGGNNYENSEVVIDIDVNDATADGKRSFVAGMGKEVGAYKADDADEISGIDLGSATHGQHNADLINAGKVSISSDGTAPVYGMLGLRHADNVADYSEERELGDFVNAETGTIDISAPNAREAYGIRVNNLINKPGLSDKSSTVTNDGKINLTGGSNVYGIAAKNAQIFNNGDININATGDNVYGIHADNSYVENNGNITINSGGDNTYGIYAVNNSAVKNSGVITINGDTSKANAADGKFINIDSSSYIINANTIVSSSTFDTQSLGGGALLMTTGSNIVAPEVSGVLTLSSDITTGNNNDTYTLENMIRGNTDNLQLTSQSVMFSASMDGNDGTLNRNSFNSLLSNNSLAQYLEDNYKAGNVSELFDSLKEAQTRQGFNEIVDKMFGQNMFSRMTFEDMSMMREVNLDMTKNMFTKEGAFEFGGSVSPYSYENGVGSIGRYAINGFNYGKFSYGLGISIADVNSYDDNQENSRNDQSFVMSLPVGRKLSGFELISTPKIGYAYGEYNRSGFNNYYKGKVYKRMFALMNEARYPLDVGKMKFTPSAEFNMIGFNIKGSEEAHKPYNLRIGSQNHYSVEAGVGLAAEKDFTLYKLHKFSMNAGVGFYHEFANPYEIDVCMSDMDGMYRLHDEKRHNNRTVIRAGFDYEYSKTIEMSASLLSNIDGEYRTDAVCDVKYHF